MSTAAHSETDGQTERVNRVLEDVLHSYAMSFESQSAILLVVEFAINNAVHESSELTPFFVNNARHPRVPAVLALRSPHDSTGPTRDGGESDGAPKHPALMSSEDDMDTRPPPIDDPVPVSQTSTSEVLNGVAARTRLQRARRRCSPSLPSDATDAVASHVANFAPENTE
ncbi:hypothetical protein PC110_g17177 [Phytophthora cactorum]|uniref:Integrase catalytic domain-containing protein n=2 Tax=Phytophthora cactorum TaxID=29920 RepID=A0A329RQE7_9STRA|nr:hypothetical protein PC117_g21420 [Phytophthora cactorum]RAW26419.1 hypothetical protein PC110_g17177 [Phytophthora cactorum]